MSRSFISHMPAALREAHLAAQRGETPVGAVIVDRQNQLVVAAAGNETRANPDPTAHAEILAIRRACAALNQERLEGCEIWVTLEPCPMCAGAILHARLDRLIFGASDPKGGGVLHGPRVFEQPTALHQLEVVSGIDADAAAALLKTFFLGLRKARKGQL